MRIPRRAVRGVVGLLCCLALPGTGSARAQAQDAQASELDALRAEVAQLRAEVEALKSAIGASVTDRSASGTRAGETQPGEPAQLPDPRVELVQAQVAELAQTSVQSASRFPVRLFGTVHSHTFTNSGEANWLDVPNVVPPRPGDGATGSFASALRQTRLGLAFDGPRLGTARTSGVVAMDFFGGIPGFQTGQAMGLPRLLVAYARIEGERTALHIGQDHMVLAPRDPSSLAAFSFPGLFRSGNLYLRAPQVTLERELGRGLRLAGGIMSPNAGDLPDGYTFVPPALAGERSRTPAVQARLGYTRGALDDRRHALAGVSGHYGRERRGTDSGENWAAAVDVALRRDWVGLAGEAFAGENIDAFGGGMGLDGRAAGGWAELQVYPADRWRVHAGVGLDTLRDASPLVPRRRSRGAYGNVMFAITPEIEASFEYWQLWTKPGSGAGRRNHHVDWVLLYRF